MCEKIGLHTKKMWKWKNSQKSVSARLVRNDFLSTNIWEKLEDVDEQVKQGNRVDFFVSLKHMLPMSLLYIFP